MAVWAHSGGTRLVVALLLLLAVDCARASAVEIMVVSWTDNSPGMASFRVERRTVPGTAFNTIADLSAWTTAYRDTNVIAGATYCYRVKAYDFTRESGYSNEACGSPIASTYAVTVSKTGTGAGTITSSPTGINCGTDCSGSFGNGGVVTLTATPNAGSAFDGWSSGCAGTASCTLAANAPVAVTAQFSMVVDLNGAEIGSENGL